MTTAERIKINYYTEAAYEQASSFPCPRNASDVYNLGVSMQYCVRAKYLEIAALLNDNTYMTAEAARQLTAKEEIEKMAAFNLNEQLGKFYAMGGPIMEDPVTTEAAQQTQPFFSRITSRFLETLNETASQVLTKKIKPQEITAVVGEQMTSAYMAMGRMFAEPEMKNAFTELMEAVPS